MLLHIDGSRHRWFQDERWYDLIVILDDASSEIYYAQLVEEESTLTVMAGLKEVIERKGVFCALYSDRGSHFWLTPKVGGKVDPHRLTQVGRALRELGIQMIPAYSTSGPGRDGCRRNCGCTGSRLWARPMLSCGSTTWSSSTAVFRCGRRNRAAPLCRAAAGIWI